MEIGITILQAMKHAPLLIGLKCLPLVGWLTMTLTVPTARAAPAQQAFIKASNTGTKETLNKA